MSDHANASIPPEIREQFQRDEQGRILFFTAPPANDEALVAKEGRALGHSAKYLAAKAKREAARAAKRKADEAGAKDREEAQKKARADAEQKLADEIADVRAKALHALEDQLASATRAEFEMLMGKSGDEALAKSLDRLVEVQAEAVAKRVKREERLRGEEKTKRVEITGMTVRLEEKI